MHSSTSHHESSRPRHLGGLLVALLVIAPMVWLTMIEVAYLLAYAACADNSNSWIHKPNAFFAGIAALCAATGWVAYRRFKRWPKPIGFLAGMAWLFTALTLIATIALVIPPLILHPCD